jgi:hypothetical protein
MMRRGVNARIPARRLHNQYIARPARLTPADLVAWLGAVQAQEFQPARWGLAQRLRGTALAQAIDGALEAGEILRTHVLRPTWHFVARDDLGWMLQLTGPRLQRQAAAYYRNHGLEPAELTRAAAVFERAVAGGRHLTRAELGDLVAQRGRRHTSMQLGFLTFYAELEGIICSGPHRGRHATYALIAERAPKPRRLERDEALAELTRRYFASHGPATVRDFVWWSGLPTSDAKRGLDMIRARREDVDGLTYWTAGQVRIGAERSPVHLLPIYDEYLVSYRDRVAVPHRPGTVPADGASVTFQHAVVSSGHVVGTWRVTRRAAGVAVRVFPLRPLKAAERRALEAEAGRYGRYISAPITLSIE